MDDIDFKKYFELMVNSLEKRFEQKFCASEKALKKAEDSLLVRLESMNEFRAQINSERNLFITKESVAQIVEAVDRRIKKLEMAEAFSSGKMWMVMAIFASIPTAIGLAALIFTIVK